MNINVEEQPMTINQNKFNGDVPPLLAAHQMMHLEQNGGVLILFGGIDNNGNYQNDLYSWNITNFQWKRVCVKSKKPEPRILYRIAKINEQRIVMHGGQSIKDQSFDDLWIVEIKSQCNDAQFEEIIVHGKKPNARISHSLAYYKNQLILFGGMEKVTISGVQQQIIKNDLWIMNNIDQTNPRWTLIEQKQDIWPPNMCGQSSCILHNTAQTDEGVYFFGGGENYISNSMYHLQQDNQKQWIWKELCENEIQSPRSNHQALFYKNYLILLGGKSKNNQPLEISAWNLETKQWVSNIKPCKLPFQWFACSLIEDYVYIHGGRNCLNPASGQIPFIQKIDLRYLLNIQQQQTQTLTIQPSSMVLSNTLQQSNNIKITNGSQTLFSNDLSNEERKSNQDQDKSDNQSQITLTPILINQTMGKIQEEDEINNDNEDIPTIIIKERFENLARINTFQTNKKDFQQNFIPVNSNQDIKRSIIKQQIEQRNDISNEFKQFLLLKLNKIGSLDEVENDLKLYLDAQKND